VSGSAADDDSSGAGTPEARSPRSPGAPSLRTTARAVTVGVALTYLVAFLSLAVQVRGLLGSGGILPAGAYLEAVRQALGGGPAAWWRVPTLAWLAPGGAGLVALCLGGAAAALLLALGVAPFLSALVAWLLYLSLEGVGQDFLAFQWDLLLLEAGFLLLFLVPLSWTSGRRRPGPWLPAVWLFRWLLFRLILESGIVKLASGDPVWRDLTALSYHYGTQPIPNLVAWYAWQLPLWFQKLSTLVTFVVELAVPVLFLLPRRPRMVGGALLVGHQGLIALTGNFGFFNLLTIAIALSLFDDDFWVWLLRRLPGGAGLLARPLPGGDAGAPANSRSAGIAERARRVAAVGFLGVAVVVGTGQLVRAAGVEGVPRPVLATWRVLAPFGVLNSYGLFATMTTRRPELVVEARRDGGAWRELDFRWKTDDPEERPRQVAPYMPRLDWQMWFAALRAERASGAPAAAGGYDAWLLSFVERLLAGAPRVWRLLAPMDGFRGANGDVRPPDQIRVLLYDYTFATRAAHAATGDWWERRQLGTYVPPVRRTADGHLQLVAADGGSGMDGGADGTAPGGRRGPEPVPR
jgi:lipase maturation factor 1